MRGDKLRVRGHREAWRPMARQRESPITVSVQDGTATIAVFGDLDMAATFIVEPAVEATLREPGLRHITLDLSGLTFIDSTGMSLIVNLHTEARATGIALAIIPAPRHVQRAFEVTGLTAALPFHVG